MTGGNPKGKHQTRIATSLSRKRDNLLATLQETGAGYLFCRVTAGPCQTGRRINKVVYKAPEQRGADRRCQSCPVQSGSGDAPHDKRHHDRHDDPLRDQQLDQIRNHILLAASPHPFTEERTFQHRFDLTWSEPKEKPRKIRKPQPKKPKVREPRVPSKTPEEQHEARRVYDQARNQQSERKEAARLHTKKVR